MLFVSIHILRPRSVNGCGTNIEAHLGGDHWNDQRVRIHWQEALNWHPLFHACSPGPEGCAVRLVYSALGRELRGRDSVVRNTVLGRLRFRGAEPVGKSQSCRKSPVRPHPASRLPQSCVCSLFGRAASCPVAICDFSEGLILVECDY